METERISNSLRRRPWKRYVLCTVGGCSKVVPSSKTYIYTLADSIHIGTTLRRYNLIVELRRVGRCEFVISQLCQLSLLPSVTRKVSTAVKVC